ncbi:MAG: NYN domain-containing protein [Myxococcota bacterium]
MRGAERRGAESLRLLAEAASSAGIVAAIVGLGLLGASWSRTGVSPYPLPGQGENVPSSEDATALDASALEDTRFDAIRLWLVDGFNVLHVGLLSGRERSEWWRRERRAELLARVERFRPGGKDAKVWVVFDGDHPPPPDEAGEGRVGVVFAPSADDWLISRVREAAPAQEVAVVTADRRLAARARHRGATVVSPRSFISRCT